MLAYLILCAALAWPTMDEPVTHRGGCDPTEKGKLTTRVETMEKDALTASDTWAQLSEVNVRVTRVLDYNSKSIKTEIKAIPDPQGTVNNSCHLSKVDGRHKLNRTCLYRHLQY